MIQLIIFDMDGLMIDSERITMQAYLDVGRAWGLPVTEEQFIEILGKNSTDIKNQYRRDFGEGIEADRLFREVGALRDERIRTRGVPVKKGLRNLLAVLTKKASDIPLAVASGSDRELIGRHLESIGLAGHFRELLSSRDVSRGKPAPDVFLALCETFKASPEETLVFEDSPNGIRAGLAGGFKVIAVPDLQPVPDELRQECLAVVEDLDEAIAVLQELL